MSSVANLYELTHPQKRIWHVERSHPGTSMWNNAGTLKIHGTIDVGKLEQAIRLFVAANDAMRLQVTMKSGQPFQYVASPQSVPIEHLDFRESGIKALYDWDTRQTQAPMLLFDNPLSYFAIALLSSDEGFLYAKFHHLVSDGVTFVVAANKIMELYDMLLCGKAPTGVQAMCGASYLDYVEEEKSYLASKRFERDEAFWLERFADASEPTVLKAHPSDHFDTKARRKACMLSLDLSRSVRSFCQDRHLSVFVLLLAAFAIYANRVLEKTDVVVGAPVSNRTSSAMRNRLGMFVSTVPVRIAVDDEMSFEEFAHMVSREWFAVLKHQRYPYELLVARLRERGFDIEQLYDVSLSFQVGSFAKASEAFSYEGRWHFSGHQANAFNIHWNDREGDGRYVIDYDYLSPLFAVKEVDFIHEHICNIVADALEHPQKKLYELDILSHDEYEKVVYGFNKPAGADSTGMGAGGADGAGVDAGAAGGVRWGTPGGMCGMEASGCVRASDTGASGGSVDAGPRQVDASARQADSRDLVCLWARRVKEEPEAVALVHQGVPKTVRELDEQSSALACALQERGVRLGDVVALLCVRSDAYVVAALGALKAGAAFMPVDKALPAKRVACMLDDARVRIVLCDDESCANGLASAADGGAGVGAGVDSDNLHAAAGDVLGDAADASALGAAGVQGACVLSWQTLCESGNCKAYVSPRLQPHDAAYVIYTSGSTGTPKGVVVEHHSIAHFACVMKGIWTSGSRMLCAGPVSFDISVMEGVIGLACGKTLVIATDDEANYPNKLCQLIGEQDVDMMMVTPGRMEMLLSSPLGATALRRLRVIGMGADALPLDLLKRVQALTSARIMNFYGPTEGTIAATYCDLTHRADVNIGRPLPGAKAYILDAHRNPVPIGVRGELYLGGEGVARGYVGRSDLTEERFVASPFCAAQEGSLGERLYRTGDAARFFPRGEIQLQGRIDNQVKIRGYRVELGEIENKLMQVAGVSAAVAVADVASDGRKYLVGYVAGSDLPSESAIKQALSASLPFYLVPAYVVCLPSLPLTSNGKIDRARLPKPTDQHRRVLPVRTETERKLASIWKHVLGVSDVGRDDNFFDIGGDSLAIVHMVAQVTEEFDVDVSLEDIYKNPTVAACAALVDVAQERSIAPVRAVPARTYYPATSTQKRMMAASLQDAGTAYNVCALYVFSGTLDKERLREAFGNLVLRHAVLRTQLCVRNDAIMQQVLKTVPLPFESLTCDDASLLKTARAQVRPFDIMRAPLVRLVSVQSPRRCALLFDFHHAICDQAGLHVLLQDFSALYAKETLPALALDYPDCAVWLEKRDASFVGARDAAYWREELSRPVPLLALPTQKKRGGPRRGATVSACIPEGRLPSLRAFVHEEHTTLASALMMSFGLVLARSAGQDEVVVGMPVACRGQMALQQVAGAFVNTVPVRCRFRRGRTVRAGFQAIDQAHKGACAHQDYPYERMVADASPARERGRNPLFDVMLVVGTGDEPLVLDGVEAKPAFASDATAKLDLTLFVYDRGSGLECRLEYDKGLFSAAFARRMLARFVHVTTTLFDAPYAPLDRVCALPPEEYKLVVEEFSSGGHSLVPRKCLPEWVDDEAVSRPADTALVACDGRLTFAELSWRINSVARALAAAGVRPGAIVAVVMRRRIGLVPVLLGVMKAGAAYVPVDPTYPDARVAYMLQDSGACAVVCDTWSYDLVQRALGDTASVRIMQAESLDTCAGLGSGRTHVDDAGGSEGSGGLEVAHAEGLAIARAEGGVRADSACAAVGSDDLDGSCVDGSEGLGGAHAKLAPELASAFSVDVSPDSSAYVIYTSGSTGLPKGSVLTRRGVSNLKDALGPVVGYDRSWTVVSVTTMSFDIFMADALIPLCFGCKVVLADEEELRQPHLLARLIEREGVTFLQTTPTRLGIMLDSKPFVQAAQSLRNVVVAGEKPADALVRRVKRRLPKAHLKNGYGPTEVTVYTSFQDLGHTNRVSIGRPLANINVRILDEEMRPVPLGSVGEAYISGAGVSPGYLARPELNAERFVASPFEAGEIMYKSGDACSFGENGEIFIHGRVDNQVKLRGLRIEPEEIEAHMLSCAGVRQAAVAVHGEGAKKKLIAFYAGSATAHDLREHLASLLPSYMVPAQFVHLDQLPLTANGKIDRTRLPFAALSANEESSALRQERQVRNGQDAQGCQAGSASGAQEAQQSQKAQKGQKGRPQNGKASQRRKLSPDERQFLRAFERVLDVRGITFDDNVFELGGDSLSIIAVQARLAAAGKTLKTQDFYDAPTLGHLYARLSTGMATSAGASAAAAASASADAGADTSASLSAGAKAGVNAGANEGENENAVASVRPKAKASIGRFPASHLQRLGAVAASSCKAPLQVPACVLVTGATGFLGAHVVAELARRGMPEIVCLVRAESDEAARSRMAGALEAYFPDEPACDRIRVVRGNIEHDLSALAQELSSVDAVVHCAAFTDHVGSRQTYENINVLGARHVAQLAMQLGARLVHVSTTSVAGLGAGLFDESSYYVGQEVEYNEYARSKFLAEGEVLDLFDQGLSGFIARVGNLCGRVCDGVFQRDPRRNAFAMRLVAFAALGCYPQDAGGASAIGASAGGAFTGGASVASAFAASASSGNASAADVSKEQVIAPTFEMTPVDVCARALVSLLLHEGAMPRIVHLQNDQTLSMQQLAGFLSVAASRDIVPVGRPEFAHVALTRAKKAFNQMFGVVRDVVEGASAPFAPTPVSSGATSRLLASLGVRWPQVDQSYFSSYFKQVTESLSGRASVGRGGRSGHASAGQDKHSGCMPAFRKGQ